jgi:hypothetical protein
MDAGERTHPMENIAAQINTTRNNFTTGKYMIKSDWLSDAV